MKKFRIISIIVVMSFMVTTAVWAFIRINDTGLTIDAQDGGPNGYNYTYSYKGAFQSYIKCRNPGYEPLHNILGTASEDEKKAVEYAFDKISNNILKGKEENTSLGYHILWKASDSTGLTTFIQVWPIGGTQPSLP